MGIIALGLLLLGGCGQPEEPARVSEASAPKEGVPGRINYLYSHDPRTGICGVRVRVCWEQSPSTCLTPHMLPAECTPEVVALAQKVTP